MMTSCLTCMAAALAECLLQSHPHPSRPKPCQWSSQRCSYTCTKSHTHSLPRSFQCGCSPLLTAAYITVWLCTLRTSYRVSSLLPQCSTPVFATFLSCMSKGLNSRLPSAAPRVKAVRCTGRPAACNITTTTKTERHRRRLSMGGTDTTGAMRICKVCLSCNACMVCLRPWLTAIQHAAHYRLNEAASTCSMDQHPLPSQYHTSRDSMFGMKCWHESTA